MKFSPIKVCNHKGGKVVVESIKERKLLLVTFVVDHRSYFLS